MIEQSIARLGYLINTIPTLLNEMDETDFSFTPLPNKWSKKEILGHLIDSATNNHHRFVRGQFEHNPAIRYDQDKWNEFGFYQQIDTQQIISFWTIYNQQLVELIKRIPQANLTRQVQVGDSLLTLEFLIVDYVRHMEHHLRQIVAYE